MPKIVYRPNPTPPPFVPPVPIYVPLTFTAQEANSSIAFNVVGSVLGVSLSYSTDNGQTWNPYTFGQSINLDSIGKSVMIKGDNNSFSIDESNFIQVQMIGKIAASGSLAYLIDSNGDNKALTPYCFVNLFSGCTSLVQAPALPTTSLADSCYAYMFEDCTSLVNAPTLPATSLADSCYANMFSGCNSLVNAPTLPATSLADSCYASMFNGCNSLVNAPTLPATSLTKYCYTNMFSGCTSLVQAPTLPATSLAVSCYASMFIGCTLLVQAPALPATSLADSCYSNMFYGCTSLVQTPILPATSLVDSCYQSMFSRCTSLNFVQCNATDISAEGCLEYWLEYVSDTGTFKKNPLMDDWPEGVSGIPYDWTVEDI